MEGAVRQPYHELLTGARPCLLRLPSVGVLVVVRIVGEPARFGAHSIPDAIHRSGRITRDLLGLRVACREDVRTLISAQAEPQQDGIPGLDGVKLGGLLGQMDRIDARELVGDAVCVRHESSVTGFVLGLHADASTVDGRRVYVATFPHGTFARIHTRTVCVLVDLVTYYA